MLIIKGTPIIMYGKLRPVLKAPTGMKIGVSIVKWGRLHPGCVNGKKKWLLCRETGRVACIEFLSLLWKFLRSVPIFISFDIFYLFTVSCLDFSPNFEHFGREKIEISLCVWTAEEILFWDAIWPIIWHIWYFVWYLIWYICFFFKLASLAFIQAFFFTLWKKYFFL